MENKVADKIKLLVLCTGNSCRSQMAEGWIRALKGDVIDVWSAGIEVHGMNPEAVRAMAEAGVDISAQFSKSVSTLMAQPFDYVVTVCGNAAETCPMFPGRVKRIHVGFDDPPRLAAEIAARGGSVEEQREVYRRVRDEIRAWVETLPASLADQDGTL
ncbi:MAG: arsenate reductase ArsC [Sphaerochaetaceae bacterium]